MCRYNGDWLCHSCNKRFISPVYLRTHMYNHTGWPHVCPHCSQGFDARSSLERNISYVHGFLDPHVCCCGKRFNSVSLLNVIRKKVITLYEYMQCSLIARWFKGNIEAVPYLVFEKYCGYCMFQVSVTFKALLQCPNSRLLVHICIVSLCM